MIQRRKPPKSLRLPRGVPPDREHREHPREQVNCPTSLENGDGVPGVPGVPRNFKGPKGTLNPSREGGGRISVPLSHIELDGNTGNTGNTSTSHLENRAPGVPGGVPSVPPDRERPAWPLAAREIFELPLRWWGAIPAPLTASVALEGFAGPITFTASREAYAAAQAAHEVAFSPLELAALVRGCESGRAWREDFSRWCERKTASPRFRLGDEEALLGARYRLDPRPTWWSGSPPYPAHWLRHGWTLGRLLGWLNAELLVLCSSEPEGPWWIVGGPDAQAEPA